MVLKVEQQSNRAFNRPCSSTEHSIAHAHQPSIQSPMLINRAFNRPCSSTEHSIAHGHAHQPSIQSPTAMLINRALNRPCSSPSLVSYTTNRFNILSRNTHTQHTHTNCPPSINHLIPTPQTVYFGPVQEDQEEWLQCPSYPEEYPSRRLQRAFPSLPR